MELSSKTDAFPAMLYSSSEYEAKRDIIYSKKGAYAPSKYYFLAAANVV
jgi:hypothetical protein